MDTVNTNNTVYDRERDLESIGLALSEKDTCGLQVEVLWSAMCYLQDHPGATITAAINYGFGEWVK